MAFSRWNDLIHSLVVGFVLCAFAVHGNAQAGHMSPARPQTTYCNPLDIDYRFDLNEPSRREAADPTMVVYRGQYWLFASKSGGYWRSKDLHTWQHIYAVGYPVESYAPTVVVIENKLYLSAFGDPWIYTTGDPSSGKWTKAAPLPLLADPDLFLDDDRRLYGYDGCSDKKPLQVREFDFHNSFKVVAGPKDIVVSDMAHHGWEHSGDQNEIESRRPYIEGAWMTKHDGKYYLQYAVPGTQYKTYADGLAVSTTPTGPFVPVDYNPVSFKPTGFIAGAGHSSTFQDLSGAYWHISSMSISVRHPFERRLGLFPSWFTPDGQMVVDTYLGDYPHTITRSGNESLVGWMLLDYNKPVTASSSLSGHTPDKAVDEDVRTWWSAATGNPGEWLQVDMGGTSRIDAVQINFADEGSVTLGKSTDAYRYKIEQSADGQHWKVLVDRHDNRRDAPHEYIQLNRPAMARYVRITNVHTPGSARFSVSGLRLFGNGLHPAPGKVTGLRVERNPSDARRAMVSWNPVANADFYIVRFGIGPDRTFGNYQVYGNSKVELRSLNSDVAYSFTVDAVNDSGITPSGSIVFVPADKSGEIR